MDRYASQMNRSLVTCNQIIASVQPPPQSLRGENPVGSNNRVRTSNMAHLEELAQQTDFAPTLPGDTIVVLSPRPEDRAWLTILLLHLPCRPRPSTSGFSSSKTWRTRVRPSKSFSR